MRAVITAVGDEGPGVVALRQVVAQLRVEHKACGRSVTVCNLRVGSCPWVSMWDEDVDELLGRLAAAGFSIERK